MSYDESNQTAQHFIESLVHKTARNTPLYTEFDKLFYKFPSYLLREAAASAYGIWKSFRSNYLNWENERDKAAAKNKKFYKNPPTLAFEHNAFPVLYKGNMYKEIENTEDKDAPAGDEPETERKTLIKIYKNKDWVWHEIKLEAVDLPKRGVDDWKPLSPKLVKKNDTYFLHYAFEKEIALHSKTNSLVRIMAIDMGLTNTCVCSIMDSDGTLNGKIFINLPAEKDHQNHLINKVRKAQSKTFGAKCPSYWNC